MDVVREVIDIRDLLSHPITSIPLSIAHSDGSVTKTTKSVLTKVLEGKQKEPLLDISLSVRPSVYLVDGGLILYEVLPRHKQSTYRSIVRDIMVHIYRSAGIAMEVHLLLDKYVTPSIKDPERRNRGGGCDEDFVITGLEKKQKKNGSELLKNYRFKNAFLKFMMEKVQNEQYAAIIDRKTVYISNGGNCIELKVNSMGLLVVSVPPQYQGQHEEADTLIAYHTATAMSGDMTVHSSDTDVMVILLPVAARHPHRIIFDYGSGNDRRYISVSEIAHVLEDTEAGTTEAVIGFHAQTGCDYTSAFYRKGKQKLFEIMQKGYVKALQSLCGDEMDVLGLERFGCHVYGNKKAKCINEARAEAFFKMVGTGKFSEQVRKINCASLPPCKRTLLQHLNRAHYVSLMWTSASKANPTAGINPINSGWQMDATGNYTFQWFLGPVLPEELKKPSSTAPGTEESEEDPYECDTDVEEYVHSYPDQPIDTLSPDTDGEPWSGDSGSESETD